eukprot:SAG31_NODE_487_length_14980_cov_9.526376_15_plen_222_part_00
MRRTYIYMLRFIFLYIIIYNNYIFICCVLLRSYVGCFVDDENRDVDGIAASQNGNTFNDGSEMTPYIDMGSYASPDICAELCAGYAFFALQFYNQCFCDNANMMQTAAPESECNTPCNNGIGDDGAAVAGTTMCGGTWRNSIYRTSTNYWENPGFDDSSWEMANDLGSNGVAPWYHRPEISASAHWIWTSQAGAGGSSSGHDRVFCRYTQVLQIFQLNGSD